MHGSRERSGSGFEFRLELRYRLTLDRGPRLCYGRANAIGYHVVAWRPSAQHTETKPLCEIARFIMTHNVFEKEQAESARARDVIALDGSSWKAKACYLI